MNKKLIIGSVLLLLTLSVSGQIQIGIKGGYNYFWIIRSNTNNSHSQTDFYPKENSYSIGCFFIDQSRKYFNPSIEISYQSKSIRIINNYSGLGGSTHSNNNFELAFLNLILKPRFLFGSNWKFILNTGIYFNFLVNSNVNSTRSSWIYLGGASDTTYQGSAKQFIQSPSIGILAGFGVQITASNKIQILIENNYSIGIFGISKSQEIGNLYNFLTTEFTVGIAYRIETSNSKE